MPSKKQLFCFTYAGGSASFFETIERDLPELMLVKPEYPGHGMRRKEPLCTSFDELAVDMLRQMKESRIEDDYALFGYSMGSITLVEVLKRILGEGLTPPKRVFLAAHEPMTKAFTVDIAEDLDTWVKERTIRFGTLPEKLIGNESFWRLYLPLYRADYSMIGKYHFEDLVLKTEIPATIFYSETDTPWADMAKWKNYFAGECEFCRFTGSHFFIQQYHREIADIIRKAMA